MTTRVRQALVLIAALTIGTVVRAATPEHRITVSEFEMRPVLDADVRDHVTHAVVTALQKDGRAAVLVEPDLAVILHRMARTRDTPSAYAPSTMPKTGKLVAGNYLLDATIYEESSQYTVELRLSELETTYRVGSTTRQWRKGASLPDFTGVAAELLAFIPRPSPLPPGFLTIEVTPPQSVVRLLHETTTRTAPLRQLRLRPSRYAMAVFGPDDTYEPFFDDVVVRSGEETVRKITLERRKTDVTLPHVPKGGALFFDARPVALDQETIRTEAGKHEIAIVMADGEIHSMTVESGVRQNAVASLEPNFAALRREGMVHVVHETMLGAPPVSGCADDLDVAVVTQDRLSVINALTGTERWGDDRHDWRGAPALLDDVLLMAGEWLKTTTTTSGRGEATTSTTPEAELLAYERHSGKLLWRETYDHATIADVDGNRALVVVNGGLRVVEGNEKSRPIALDLRRSNAQVEVTSARFGGNGVIVANESGTTLRTFSMNGQPGWQLDVPDGIGFVESANDRLLVVTRGKRLLAIAPATGTIRWERPYDRPIRFVRFDGPTVLVLDGANGIDRIDLASGRATTYSLNLGDLPIVTGCELTSQGRIVLLVADHRLVVINPVSMQVEWPYDSEERIVWFGIARGLTTAVTASGRLAVMGLSERNRIAGWIESIDPASHLARVRTVTPALGPERLHVFELADYRARRSPQLSIDVAERHASHDGIVELPFDPAVALTPGQLLVRGGAIRVAEGDDDTAVWIDGSFECRRGCVISGLAAGEHDVLVTRKGFEPFRQTVDVETDVVDVVPVLDRASADTRLTIDTLPRGAEVFVGGTYAGTTDEAPVEWTRLLIGQFSEVRAKKFGYRVEQKPVGMEESRRSETFVLRPAPRSWEVALGLAATTSARILGWADSSITRDGVVGAPLRETEAKQGPLFGHLLLSTALGRFVPEATADVRGSTKQTFDWSAGASYDIGHLPMAGDTTIGLRYVATSGGASSSPPSVRNARGEQDEDPSAPLERWSHPIANVFVRNQPPRAFELMATMRPQVYTFVRVAAGIVRDESFAGEVLVPDPGSGHLVRDPSRSYFVTTESGWRASVEAQTPLALLVRPLHLDVHPRLVLFTRYETHHMRYSALDDDWQRLLIGFGVVAYHWKP